MESVALDAAGHRRPPATMPGGRGISSTHGSKAVASSQSERCYASSTDRPQDAVGKHQRYASSSTMRPRRLAFDGALRRTSYGTHTQSRWHTKASRWS